MERAILNRKFLCKFNSQTRHKIRANMKATGETRDEILKEKLVEDLTEIDASCTSDDQAQMRLSKTIDGIATETDTENTWCKNNLRTPWRGRRSFYFRE